MSATILASQTLASTQPNFGAYQAQQSNDPYGLFKFLAKRQEETGPKIEEELRMLRQEASMKANNPH